MFVEQPLALPRSAKCKYTLDFTMPYCLHWICTSHCTTLGKLVKIDLTQSQANMVVKCWKSDSCTQCWHPRCYIAHFLSTGHLWSNGKCMLDSAQNYQEVGQFSFFSPGRRAPVGEEVITSWDCNHSLGLK